MAHFSHHYRKFLNPMTSHNFSSVAMEFDSSADLKPNLAQLVISTNYDAQSRAMLHGAHTHNGPASQQHHQPLCQAADTSHGYFSALMLQSTPPLTAVGHHLLEHGEFSNSAAHSVSFTSSQNLSSPSNMVSSGNLAASFACSMASAVSNSSQACSSAAMSGTRSSVVNGGNLHSPGSYASHFSLSESTAAALGCISQTTNSSGGISGSSSTLNKHICAICNDRASGKHYGVYSCEGCKGFFKRTVRKDLRYTCRDEKRCLIDKRQRNRCQYCRYQKCLQSGMKREAVQEERQRVRDNKTCAGSSLEAAGELEGGNSCDDSTDAVGDGLASSYSHGSTSWELYMEKILEAELVVESDISAYMDVVQDPVSSFCHAPDKQLFFLVPWAKRLPYFCELPLDDQAMLLKAGWEELLIATLSYRCTIMHDNILLSTGLRGYHNAAKAANINMICKRILTELVAKMRDIRIDRTELGCLRATVLFNPDVKGLTARADIESQREKLYTSLEEYCRSQYPEEPGRFSKLLLRLPALRSIGLKALEHIFFSKFIGDTPIDTFLIEMLETPPSHPSL